MFIFDFKFYTMENTKLLEIIKLQSDIILKLSRKHLESLPKSTPEYKDFSDLIDSLKVLTKSI